MLTIRDTDLFILSKLDDKDLFSTCLVNKAANKLCNDENFWRNRFLSKYGEMAAKYKPENRSWKKHYLQVVIDLEKFPKPVDFLSYILWGSEGIENSFYIENPKELFYVPVRKWIPLSKAPEWVMNNLWLSNLKDVKVKIFNNMGSEIVELKELAPIELFKKLSEKVILPQNKDQLFNLYNINTNTDLLGMRFRPNTYKMWR